jgi:hypothetical protein
MSNHTYFHSPFSETYPYEEKDRALLICFILSELNICATSLTSTWIVARSSFHEKAYDAPLHRLQEHIRLLPYAFPKHKKEGIELQEALSYITSRLLYQCAVTPQEHLQKLFLLLDAFIQECKQEKNFLFFLLDRYHEIKQLTPTNYLPKLFYNAYPEGMKKLQTSLCDYFHKKGFTAHLLTIAERIKQLPPQEVIHATPPC